MIRIFYCLVVTWLFTSCSGDIDLGPVDDKEGQNFTPTPSGRVVEGFQKHTNHVYGFDSDGDVVHISLPRDQIGYVKVLTDKVQAEDFDYFYCDLDGALLSDLEYIPADKMQEHTLKIEVNFLRKEIALCKEKKDWTNLKIIQKLYIHRYPWKTYNFYVYTFGNSSASQYEFMYSDRNSFWNDFNNVYNQAIVEYNVITNYKRDAVYLSNTKRPYILSRARGNYDDYAYDFVKCAEGDIGKVINEMEETAFPNRNAVIQVDSPVKRFWPLKKGKNFLENIEICGSPDIDQDPTRLQNINIVLELLPNTSPDLNCTDRIIHGITVRWYEKAWFLVYDDGDMELATIDNAHPECAVFAEKNAKALGQEQNIGEISFGRGAETIRKPNEKVTTAILPWQGSLNATKTVALHELGHTMGLEDVNLSSNLMHYANNGTNRILQKRGVNSYKNGKQEFQWECLQGVNFKINCASPDFIYREP